MKIKRITTEKEYNEAVAYLEELGDREDFQENKDLIEQFDLVSALVESYEKDHFKLNPGHPIEIIKLKMTLLDIQQKDLVPIIGSSGVVSEVLNKKRALSKSMIREFSQLLNIDQNILNTEYELENLQNKKEKERPEYQFLYIELMASRIQPFKKQIIERGMLFNISAEC
jgi:HTH-type transcriptional regulator/antitoxin HigA